jgi:lysozyme
MAMALAVLWLHFCPNAMEKTAMSIVKRALITTLTLSATGFAAYVGYEGFSPVAVPPVAGDVPTYGFGTTLGPDGKPLKGGEKITPPQAVKLAVRDVEVHERRLKACLAGIKLYQHEYDALMSLGLNVGAQKVCNSSIPEKLKAGDYAAACRTILDFGNFCTKPKIRVEGRTVCPPGALKPLPGLMARRQKEYRMCLGEDHE